MTEEEQEKAIKILLKGIAVGYKYGFHDGKDEAIDPSGRSACLLRRTQEELTKAFKYRHDKPIKEALELTETIENIWHKQDIQEREEFNEITI